MKIICVGRNYTEHAKELNNPVPDTPLLFMKPSSALLERSKPFFYPAFSKDIHYEAEIVLKISGNIRSVEERFAHKYYQEITIGIDFTARDVQEVCKKKGHPWEIAKAFDGSAPVGKFINLEQVNREAIGFQLRKNGTVVQDGNTKDLIFSFDHLVSYISRFFTLHTGDLIFTGTPAGVGPVQIGDALEGFIEGEHLLSCRVK